MTILLIACFISLTIRLIDLQKANRDSYGGSKPVTANMMLLFAALVRYLHFLVHVLLPVSKQALRGGEINMPHPEVHTVTFFYTDFDQKGTPFIYLP